MLKDKTTLWHELAAMTYGGLEIIQGIKVAGQQCPHPKLKQALLEIPQDMELGYTLADAMSRHPDCFDDLELNMVKAGEIGGVLDETFNRLAKLQSEEAQLKNKIQSVLVYPTIVIILMIIVSFIKQILIIHAIYFIFIIFAGFLYYQRPIGRIQIDNFLLKIPLIGEGNKKAAIVQLTATWGTLASANVPIISSLNIVRDRLSNQIIANAVEAIKQEIYQGEKIGKAVEKQGIFPPTVVKMISMGEERGELDVMLLIFSNLYAEELEQVMQASKRILDPVMIFLIGGMGGLILPTIFPAWS